MEKMLEFLEKHVQWLAVGLGGLFLAWTLWTYVLMAPVTVPGPGGSLLGPGEVDDHVRRTQTERVELLMKTEGPVQPPQETSASAVIREWDQTLKGPGESFLLAGVPFNSRPSDFKPDYEPQKVLKGQAVTSLPAVPPSETVEIKSARAYAGSPPTPPGAAGAVAAQPAPAAAPGAAALPPGRDLSYVRLTYRIPTVEIAKSFDDKKVPRDATTGVVAVRLMRQEQSPDGTWTAPVEVPFIKNEVTIYPLPAIGAGPAEVNGFRAWSDSPQGQSDLLRPTFYPVIFGEGPWDPPMDDLLPKWDPDAIRAEKARIAKEQDAKRRATPTPRAPAGGGRRGGDTGGGGGGGQSAVPDPQRPASVAGLTDVQYQPPAGTASLPGGAPAAQPPATPAAGMPPSDLLPTPAFQPPLTAPFLAWAYDESVVEGHTYRYQVLYALRSPVFASNVVQPPELAQVFSIWSELDTTKWSEKVEVKPTAELYLAGTNWTADRIPSNVKLEVFKWAQGRWQLLPFTAAPGDQVGELQNGVDFSTNTTVVDLRFDPRGNGGTGRPYVLLLTADGRLIERDPTADLKSARMNQLRQASQLGPPTPRQPGAPAPVTPTAPTPGVQPVQPGGQGDDLGRS